MKTLALTPALPLTDFEKLRRLFRTRGIDCIVKPLFWEQRPDMVWHKQLSTAERNLKK